MLIVEDHPRTREILRDLVQPQFPGSQVMTAADGKSALELCELHQPRLALVDISLPDTNGIALARTLTTRSPPVAVIMVTSMHEDIYRQHAKVAGASAYVTKDRIYQDLIPAIEAVMARFQNLPALAGITPEMLTTRFRDLLDCTPDPMLLIDASGRILSANSLACDWLGTDPGTLDNAPLATVFPALSWPPAGAGTATAQQQPAPGINKQAITARRRDGSELTVELATRVIDGSVPGTYLASMHDVTLRSREQQASNERNVALEGNLRERAQELAAHARELEQRKAELEQANDDLLSFSYSVSHDLRAPLRAISGFAQILVRRHREELGAQAQHYLDNIIEASAHMGSLIDDLLAYSRLGRTALNLQPVALDDMLAEISAYLQPHIDERNARLTIAAPLPVVTGDRTLLKQIFINLLENALTYVKPDTRPLIRISSSISAGEAIISVCDNGIGIAPEHFERIFNVFQRLHNLDEYPGTGIGLSVVRRAADLQGGKVWLESSLGSGSTFYLSLPSPGPAPAGPLSTHHDARKPQ